MKLFNAQLELTGAQVCVIAQSMDQAADVFVAFWIAQTDEAPGAFSICRGAPANYQDDQTVAELAGGDVAGVIVKQPDGHMLFEPAR